MTPRRSFARHLSQTLALAVWFATILSVALAQAATLASTPQSRSLAEAPSPNMPLSTEFFVGTWETQNVEDGRDVRIIWHLDREGTLDYRFEVDGLSFPGSTGTWAYRDGLMYEQWLRSDGSRGAGQGAVERIDDDTIKLTIVDNGDPSYTGRVRIYRRLGPPQTVEVGPTRSSL